jgi:hypothetical protein
LIEHVYSANIHSIECSWRLADVLACSRKVAYPEMRLVSAAIGASISFIQELGRGGGGDNRKTKKRKNKQASKQTNKQTFANIAAKRALLEISNQSVLILAFIVGSKERKRVNRI